MLIWKAVRDGMNKAEDSQSGTWLRTVNYSLISADNYVWRDLLKELLMCSAAVLLRQK